MSACRRWNEKPTVEKLPNTDSTSKCKDNLQLLQRIMQQTLLWVKQKNK
jgi:hypothetical protein